MRGIAIVAAFVLVGCGGGGVNSGGAGGSGGGGGDSVGSGGSGGGGAGGAGGGGGSSSSDCTPAAGLRCPAGSAWEAHHAMTPADYQQTFDTLVAQGYRLSHISGYSVAGQDTYAAIWEQCSGPTWEAHHGLTSSEFQQQFDALKAQGYRLVEVSGYDVGGVDHYAGIWEQRSGPAWEAHHALTAAEYQQTFDTLVGQGYRLVHVSGYASGTQELYAAIWEQCGAGTSWEARNGLSAASYQQTFDTLVGQGYRPLQVSGYTVGGQELYAAIFDTSASPSWQALHGIASSAEYQQAFDMMNAQGYRLVDVSGYEGKYAAIWSQ